MKELTYLFRAIAFLEIEKFSKCVDDCKEFLKKEPNSKEVTK